MDTKHPVFPGVKASSRGILRQMKGKTSIHFSAEATNTELLFEIVFSTNQLSINGAVSNWCYQHESSEGEQPRVSSEQEKNINQGLMDSV